jgi:hypothetical protein
MQRDNRIQWQDYELQFVEHELAREYPRLSLLVISSIVDLAKSEVPPTEGWAKLLAILRRDMAQLGSRVPLRDSRYGEKIAPLAMPFR